MGLRIVLEPNVAIALEAITHETGNQEFSGFGWINRVGEELRVYDYVVLNVGTMAYTEISAEKVKELAERPDAANMRLWFHRHPVGNDQPGWHNWSGTDNATIQEAPLGGIPQIIQWSASIVRTPEQWVGRIDNHITGKTIHVPVEGQAPLELRQEVRRMVDAFFRAHHASRATLLPSSFRRGELEAWDEAGYDPDEGMETFYVQGIGSFLAADLEDLAEQLGCDVSELVEDDHGAIAFQSDSSAEDEPGEDGVEGWGDGQGTFGPDYRPQSTVRSQIALRGFGRFLRGQHG